MAEKTNRFKVTLSCGDSEVFEDDSEFDGIGMTNTRGFCTNHGIVNIDKIERVNVQ